jgi:hypothetical protein
MILTQMLLSILGYVITPIECSVFVSKADPAIGSTYITILFGISNFINMTINSIMIKIYGTFGLIVPGICFAILQIVFYLHYFDGLFKTLQDLPKDSFKIQKKIKTE